MGIVSTNVMEDFKMIGLRLEKYFIWFFVNFFICLLPFLIMWVSNYSETHIFSGFLAYNFTLLISSLYLFKNLTDIEKDGMKKHGTVFWITVGWLFILYGLLISYPKLPRQEINLWLLNNAKTCILIIILITFIIALLLNKPSIEEKILQLQKSEPYKKSQEMIESFKDKKTILDQENNP